jgi:hypothetical protein
MRVKRAGLGLALLAAGAACSPPSPPPINPTFTQGVVHESFSGTLPPLGFRFYSFTLTQTGNVDITLLRLRENGQDTDTAVTVAIGLPRGTDCAAANAASARAGATPQLALELDPAIYCVRVSDAGTLSGPAEFWINITRPQ